ncbi:CHAP domain-containing protein [Streptococcus pseudoporcinus]|uniref:N-acetylmuramoyl-L-alanine amidase n=1 Tax=Streptococcus pseudoporcinus LQ 940-04 TaxID=875093 RepID=G5KAF9_9STRE|nr:CHAP domain-containing protein [Streptococcus pseudoporcinus]EFR45140.1 CHAP domain protein [Streptococcus pseudoporcinus SPIN 20026]EHI65075.1 CHAP domain protein [Streptococcus pseudoporcinus LQ 940-04]VEF93821.1 amidase [Streptococcus pseudoporcinus]
MKYFTNKGILFLLLISLGLTTLFPSCCQPVRARVIGDDYPINWKSGWGADSWGMYLRQCTSFVAYRLHNVNGFSLPPGYGNADSWGHVARRKGYQVDSNPQVGSVAWFDKGVNLSHRDYGHVAWVAEVKGNLVTLEEYNYNAGQGPEKYHRREILRQEASGYIHFKDLINNSSNTSISQLSRQLKLPSKGSYTFSQRRAVKAHPSLNSSDLVYYEKGNIVHYDKVLEVDGYRWLSYIGGSGNRRYVAIEKLEQQVGPREFQVEQIVQFKGPFQVSHNHGWMISSDILAGGPATQLNWLDPGPLVETSKNGQKAGDQVLYPGDYFSIPGEFKILQIDQKSKGIKIKIGQKETWVSMDHVHQKAS